MILLGINGGMRQGKSTVGAELRRLAGVDSKADLEFSYPIGQVANLWVQQWPPSVVNSGLPIIEIANKLIPLVADSVKTVTGYDVDTNALLITDAAESQEKANRLLSYLQKYIEAGDDRGTEFPVPIGPSNKVLNRALYQWIGARMIEEVDAGTGHDVWTRVIEKRIATLQERGYALVTVGGTRYLHQQAIIRAAGGLIVQVSRPGITSDNDVTEQIEARKNPDIRVINNGTVDELNTAVSHLYEDLLAGNPKSSYSAV